MYLSYSTVMRHTIYILSKWVKYIRYVRGEHVLGQTQLYVHDIRAYTNSIDKFQDAVVDGRGIWKKEHGAEYCNAEM